MRRGLRSAGAERLDAPNKFRASNPALRPEQSDHVPWADCPQGLSSSTGCPVSHSSYRSLCSPPTLPAGRFGLRPRPHWGHASLRDSSLRSPAGKKPLIAHFAGGARYVARTLIGKISLAIVRAPNSPFSAVKMGGPFSLRCLSPLCSPAVGTGQTQRNASLDVSAEIGWLRSAKKRASFFLSLALYILNQRCWDDSMLLGYFRNTKSQRNFISTLAFYASHEARCRAAVTPQPTRISLECPRALRARCGVQGVTPCCEP